MVLYIYIVGCCNFYETTAFASFLVARNTTGNVLKLLSSWKIYPRRVGRERRGEGMDENGIKLTLT